jgi:hypothetical protein
VDHRVIAERKALALRTWRAAMGAAQDETEKADATAAWLRRIDAINRRTRTAFRQLGHAQSWLTVLEGRASAAELTAAASRIRAEAAEAECAEARGLQAARDADPMAVGTAAQQASGATRDESPGELELVLGDRDPAATADGSTRRSSAMPCPTLELLLADDRPTHERLAAELSEMTGVVAARYLLLFHELIDELAGAALDAGELAFDHDHPFWAQFAASEARRIIRGLRDLGFRLDLHEGWYGGRAPAAKDFASAVAYAGFEVRGLRHLPTSQELVTLPTTIRVTTYDHMAKEATELTLEQVTGVLGPRAGRLDDLWDDWGKLRALLAAEVATAA